MNKNIWFFIKEPAANTRINKSASVIERRSPLRQMWVVTAALAFTALSVHAGPPGYNATSADLSVITPATNQLISDPVSVQYNFPLVSGQNSGYIGLSGSSPSGIPVISSGVYADSADGGWVQTRASYDTSLLVGSGTSGLATGTAVTLQLSLQLDGTTNVTSGTDAAYASMSYGFRIHAPDQAIYDPVEGGWYEPTIMSFGADVDNSANNFFTYYYGDPGGAYYHSTSYSAGWDWYSNLASDSGGSVDNYTVSQGDVSISDSNAFDTGVVMIVFETFIGDTLNIDTYLDVWGDTYGAGSLARTDFLNTMQASITSPYALGVDLIYGGAPTVPVPAAVWLFGSGLLGLIGLARRRAPMAVA